MSLRKCLVPALLLSVFVACLSSPPEVTSGLGAGGRAEVTLTDATRVTVRNLGPGRLRVRFMGMDRVAVWLDAGGMTEVRGRKDRRVELVADEESGTRYRVIGEGADGVALESN